MSTDTLSPRTERQVEQIAREIDLYMGVMRSAIRTAKFTLNSGAVEPEKADEVMTRDINHAHNDIAALVARQTKPVAQALADRYGAAYLKKNAPDVIGRNIANKINTGIMHDNEDYDAVKNVARDIRYRAHCIEEAGRLLRYWASEHFEADTKDAWRMDGVERVEDLLKHMGEVYCQARGHDGIVVYPDSPVGDKDVEQALRYIGNYAMERLLTGPGRWYGERSLVQIRLGDLMPTMLQDLALRIVVRLTHGALDGREFGADRIRIPYDDASEYGPGYSTGDSKHRKAFEALQP